MARDQGMPAFPRPASVIDERVPGARDFPEPGMSYMDVLVKDFLASWFGQLLSATPSSAFYQALMQEDALTEVVQKAHKLADIVMKERY